MKNVLEIKFNKKTLVSALLLAVAVLAALQLVQSGLIAYGLQRGLFCR